MYKKNLFFIDFFKFQNRAFKWLQFQIWFQQFTIYVINSSTTSQIHIIKVIII